jgi:hypothetical protein
VPSYPRICYIPDDCIRSKIRPSRRQPTFPRCDIVKETAERTKEPDRSWQPRFDCVISIFALASTERFPATPDHDSRGIDLDFRSVPVAASRPVAAQRQVNVGNRPTTQRHRSRRISDPEAPARRERCRSLSSQQTSIQDLARRRVECGKAIFTRTELTPQSTPWGLSVVWDIMSSRAALGAAARGPKPARRR